jgi:MoaA/NifB/PqqE/SkfB family radical SAM enzyme
VNKKPKLTSEEIARKIRLSNLWLFITEKCNLDCDYCFYKDRVNNETISFNQIKRLIDIYRGYEHLNIVISGGEASIEWGLVEEIARYVRNHYPQFSLMLETNTLLLNEEKIRLLKKYNVAVETGIDGDYATTARHRKGMSQTGFSRLIKNIELILQEDIKVSPTMTVHPEETSGMLANFKYLESLGLYSIDVHPAVFEVWTERASAGFIKGYEQIALYEKTSGKGLLNRSYSVPIPLSMDFLVMPSGEILPNWVYLCLDGETKKKYVFGKIEDNDLVFYKERLLFFLNEYRRFYKKGISYGEITNRNLEILRKDMPEGVSSTLSNYFGIWDQMKKIDAYEERPQAHHAYL